jgi:hypothetical protein
MLEVEYLTDFGSCWRAAGLCSAVSRCCVRVLALLADDDLAEFVELGDFDRGESAIVDADVVDTTIERPTASPTSRSDREISRKPAMFGGMWWQADASNNAATREQCAVSSPGH